MKNREEIGNWYHPKLGLQISFALIVWAILSVLIENGFNQSLSFIFLFFSLLYLVLGFTLVQINRITFIYKITENRMWLPVLATSFALLSGWFFAIGNLEGSRLFRTLALIIALIAIPASWLIQQITKGQLSQVLNDRQIVIEVFTFKNIRVFLLSPENHLKWYLQMVSVILGICALFFILFLILSELIA